MFLARLLVVVATFFSAVGVNSLFAQVSSIDEAVRLSKRTGRPIFAAAGSKSCPACVALYQRLQGDQSLAAFAPHFIPLKISTDNEEEWGTWDRKYPTEGNSIPIVYVVRADGEKLYAKAGSLSDEALPNLLRTSLANAGRMFNEKESVVLDKAVATAQPALEANNLPQAARALIAVEKLGTPGSLNSHAESAKLADALVKKLIEGVEKSLGELEAEITKPQPSFESILALTELQQSCGTFPGLKAPVGKLAKELRKNKEASALIGQSEALVAARVAASSENPSMRNLAKTRYEAVIKRFPGTPVEALAKAELENVSAGSKR